ncbi:MAG: RNA-binding S4 domain-containing protein, partial [Rhodocyclales bacterium]|nr:RNA-binding S4 domain-containing protein [Rhodocyclales bacterium]
NGSAPKPAREVKVGDRLEISNSETRWEVVVQALSEKRGPAPEARLLYEETAESIAAREAEQQRRKFTQEPAAEIQGRPTKRDRRQLDRFGG